MAKIFTITSYKCNVASSNIRRLSFEYIKLKSFWAFGIFKREFFKNYFKFRFIFCSSFFCFSFWKFYLIFGFGIFYYDDDIFWKKKYSSNLHLTNWENLVSNQNEIVHLKFSNQKRKLQISNEFVVGTRYVRDFFPSSSVEI